MTAVAPAHPNLIVVHLFDRQIEIDSAWIAVIPSEPERVLGIPQGRQKRLGVAVQEMGHFDADAEPVFAWDARSVDAVVVQPSVV